MTPTDKQIRVMHIISGDLWAGAESQAYTLLNALQSKVNLHVVLLNDGELASRLRLLHIPITVLPESSMSSLAIFSRLVGLIRSFKPEIVHTHRQKENILGGFANFAAGINSSSVRTVHGAQEFRPNLKQRLQIYLDKFVGNHLQKTVISVSADLADKLSHTFSRRNIHTIQNGVDEQALQQLAGPANFKMANPHVHHIAIVGRVEPVKRVDIFIEMAAILVKKQNIPPVHFHVIGDGAMREEMECLANSLGLSKLIHFHGHRSDIAKCLSSLDLLVMCSDHEGTPMVALESLALGTPLIAHDVGGLHELLIDQPDGLVQKHAPEAYAEKIERFLNGDFVCPVLPDKYLASTNAMSVIKLYTNLLSANG